MARQRGTARRDGIAEADELDRAFRALAHPQRRHILIVLHAQGDRVTAGRIAERFACSWPTTTRHLRVLEDAGLLSVHRQGRERLYQLEKARLRRAVGGWIAHFGRRPGVRR